MSRKTARGRRVNGILLFDKPIGVSSNAALQQVKRLYQADKAGHTGSLDPLASGLLPICFGEATKISHFLLDANKAYRFVSRLGVVTATGDAEGEVLRTQPVPALTQADVEAVLLRFVGPIPQLPPMYSALKHQGRRLYELARNGVEVERQPRTITIHKLQLLHFDGLHLDCIVRCSKGTYIRTLAEDIGTALDCGAHVSALRRTEVGSYSDESRWHTLPGLQEAAQQGMAALGALLQTPDSAISGWPELQLNDGDADMLCHGQPVRVGRVSSQGLVRLYVGSYRFLGVGEVLADGRLALRRLIRGE